MDEPLSALDAKVRLSLRKEICAIQKEMGITTIMVTHDQDEALTMADRIIVMNKAVVMQSGTPEEVYQNPENPFVADFIGSINFIRKEQNNVCDVKEFDMAAIRPEKIRLSRDEREEGIRGTIKDIEFRGSYYRVNVLVKHINKKDTNIFVDVPFTQEKEMKLALEERVYAEFPTEEMIYFKAG